MKELCISNIDYDDSRSVINERYLYLNTSGCKIYATYNKMILEWDTSSADTTNHIIKFIDDVFGDVTCFSKLNLAIENLEDDHAVTLDFNNGDFDVIELQQ